MPRTDRARSLFSIIWKILAPVIVISMLAQVLLPTFRAFRTAAENAHTNFALKQIIIHLDQSPSPDFPTTHSALIQSIHAARIDWNSCTLTTTAVLDSWDRPVTASFDPSTRTWVLDSAGPDGTHATDDDITQTFAPKTPANSPAQ